MNFLILFSISAGVAVLKKMEWGIETEETSQFKSHYYYYSLYKYRMSEDMTERVIEIIKKLVARPD